MDYPTALRQLIDGFEQIRQSHERILVELPAREVREGAHKPADDAKMRNLDAAVTSQLEALNRYREALDSFAERALPNQDGMVPGPNTDPQEVQ